MKRKILLPGLVLALILTMVMPMTALAVKPPATLIATGEIISITPGEVRPAGNSGRWVVKDRDIIINFGTGDLLEGDYTLTYHTNVVVDVEDEILQAGNLQGILTENDGDNALNVRGTISPAQAVSDSFPLTIGVDPLGNPIEILVAVHVIHIEGRWTFISGGPGNGTFTGDIFVLICEDDNDLGELIVGYDLDGHVVSVAPGAPSQISLYD